MSGTTIPAVLAALATPFGATPAFCGEPLQHQSGDFVAVAWAGPDHPAVVVATFDRAEVIEEYDVVTQLVAWQGSADLFACITRVYALLDLLVAYLTGNPTLGGACITAWVTNTALMPNQTEQGAIATLTVTTQVKATRRR